LNVAKEAVSNCLRHARADRGSLSLRVLKDCVRLTVQDNGIGFDPKKTTGVGHGLANMAARAERLGGKFVVLSKPRQGTRVVFEIPKEAPHAEPSDDADSAEAGRRP
jgi:signal transduction histidine kinase